MYTDLVAMAMNLLPNQRACTICVFVVVEQGSSSAEDTAVERACQGEAKK